MAHTTQPPPTPAAPATKLNSYQVTVFTRWVAWGIFYAENRAEAERKARDYYCYVDEKIEVLLICGREPVIAEAA